MCCAEKGEGSCYGQIMEIGNVEKLEPQCKKVIHLIRARSGYNWVA